VKRAKGVAAPDDPHRDSHAQSGTRAPSQNQAHGGRNTDHLVTRGRDRGRVAAQRERQADADGQALPERRQKTTLPWP